MKNLKTIILILTSVLLILFSSEVYAEASGEEDIEEEIKRQLEGIDFSDWDGYFEEIAASGSVNAGSITEYVFRLVDSGTSENPGSIFDTVVLMIKNEFRKTAGASALLVSSAILTCFSVVIPDEGVKKTLSVALCASSVIISVGMLGSYITVAEKTMTSMSDLSEKTAPIISASLAAVGSGASLRIFSPVFTLLNHGVIMTVKRIVLPLVVAFGVLSGVSVITEGERLDGLISFLRKSVKWILGLISTVYFGVIAVNGLTAGARDGVMIRTSKYALDKMVPIVGGMIGGTVDSVMGCALLVKNGIGVCAMLILLFKIAKPVIVLASGAFVFRVSAAVSGAASDKRVVKLYKCCAEAVTNLFACVAVSGAMFLLTILMILASGGIAAGLW